MDNKNNLHKAWSAMIKRKKQSEIDMKNNKQFTQLQKIEADAIFPVYYRNAVLPYLKNIYAIKNFTIRYNDDGTTYKEDIYDYFNDALVYIKKHKTRKINLKTTKGSYNSYEKAEIDVSKLTDAEYGLLLFINILFDNKLHKYMPFYSTDTFGQVYERVVFLMVDNGADDDLDWNLYNFFDRDSIKLATRFFQYHLKNSAITPRLAETTYNYSNTVKYVTNINTESSKQRVQKYLIYLDYLLFDLIKLEDDIRLHYTNDKDDILKNYYKIVIVVSETRKKLQNNGYLSYLNIPCPSLVNCNSHKVIKTSYRQGAHIASQNLKVVSKYLAIDNLYTELKLNKKIIMDKQLLCFIKYYNDNKEQKKDLDLKKFINSIRDKDFQYRTNKEFEEGKISKRKEEIEKLYMLGLNLEEIAIQLGVSIRTIKYNFKDIQLPEDKIREAKSNRNLILNLEFTEED